MRIPTLLLIVLGTAIPAIAAPQPAPSAPAPSGERYYMTLFGSESSPKKTSLTHTWATFVKTAVTPRGEVPVAIDTVSWMPATLQIRPLALRREQGVNLTLAQTFDWVASFDGHTSMWGPYEIDADDYVRFLARKADLEGGGIKYRALGAVTYKSRVSNCGQSFARASPGVDLFLQPTPSPGESGTSKLAQRYLVAGALKGDGATHDWLVPVIGADRPAVTARQPGERIPRSGR